MGYTNKTSHYELPQWIAGDKPSWLGDMNTAMLNIDTAIAGADASASAAESSAAAANAQVQAQETKITKNTTDIKALTENLADTQGEVNNVKTIAEGALPKSGGTMTGNLFLKAAPTSDLQAATKKYVDDKETAIIPLTSGAGLPAQGVMSGCIIGSALFFNCALFGPISTANAVLAKCAGNPLGLTTNTTYSKIILANIYNNQFTYTNANVVYDGTDTKIVLPSTLENGGYLLFYSGEVG